MARLPSIVSIDTTQNIVIDGARSALERLSYCRSAATDGRVFRHAAAIVSTSQWAADCLHRRYPDCRTPVHVMPAPVRLRSFDAHWIEQRWRRAEIVRDGQNGIVIAPGDRGELIAALRRLIASVDLRRDFGCAARRIVERWSPEIFVSKLRSIVQSIAPPPS